MVDSRKFGSVGGGFKGWNDVRWKLLEWWIVETLGVMEEVSREGMM